MVSEEVIETVPPPAAAAAAVAEFAAFVADVAAFVADVEASDAFVVAVEADAVADVLKSNKVNYWTGEQCRNFEAEFADFVGCESAIALANGTVALDLALLALDIGPGDEVVVTSRAFIASVSCIVNAGGTPVFADVDLNTQNITAETILAVLSDRTKAIICVHLAGWPCDMSPIMDLAATHKIYVIEDCAQAHGARYKGKSVGSIGHVGCWSFCQDKIISTSGEGGMIATNNTKLFRKIWSLKDQGRNIDKMRKSKDNKFRYVHDYLGLNFRMTEIQAKIGAIQLSKLRSWIKKRNFNARLILNFLRNYPEIFEDVDVTKKEVKDKRREIREQKKEVLDNQILKNLEASFKKVKKLKFDGYNNYKELKSIKKDAEKAKKNNKASKFLGKKKTYLYR